jgi:hypothetical protein
MMETVKPVQLDIGELHGRDAIYLDSVSQKAMALVFTGELDGRACRGNAPKRAWLRYRMSFFGVLAYDCRELDICRWSLVSSFDEVEGSEWLRELTLEARARECKLGEIHHYVWSTYDFIFRIAASRFELEILGERSVEEDRGTRR